MKQIRCDFKGTHTGITELTTPPSITEFMIWCDDGALIDSCHEADVSILVLKCPICKGTGKISI
jgi:hypothetical protein